MSGTDGTGVQAARGFGVDALVAAARPRLRMPVAHRRDAVLVTGPGLAGVSAVTTALTGRLPGWSPIEAADLAAGEAPAAVVFVVSAAAAVTDSDCALLDAAAAHTDVVIGAVSKIDAHPHWPQMLQIARETLAARAPRYRGMPWVGVAAAPAMGEARIDELTTAIAGRLADPAIARRNTLRGWEFQLQITAEHVTAGRGDRDAAAHTRTTVLREQRDAALRQHRASKSQRSLTLRGGIAAARVRLSHFARMRCGSLRAELAGDAARLTRRGLPGFRAHARSRIDEVIAEVDDAASAQLVELARRLGLSMRPTPSGAGPVPVEQRVEPGVPPLRSRRLETQLMLLLGGGFGLGAALTLSRLLADLAAGLTAAGAATCAVVGLAVTVWVVRTRGLLHDRSVLDRWVTEVVAALRSSAEELVALRVLSAESVLTAALARRDELDRALVADRVAALDRELREQAAAAARARAARDRKLPALRRALAAVRAELGEAPGGLVNICPP